MNSTAIKELLLNNGYIECAPISSAGRDFSFYIKNNITVTIGYDNVMIMSVDSGNLRAYNIYDDFENILKYDYFVQIEQYMNITELKAQLEKL